MVFADQMLVYRAETSQNHLFPQKRFFNSPLFTVRLSEFGLFSQIPHSLGLPRISPEFLQDEPEKTRIFPGFVKDNPENNLCKGI